MADKVELGGMSAHEVALQLLRWISAHEGKDVVIDVVRGRPELHPHNLPAVLGCGSWDHAARLTGDMSTGCWTGRTTTTVW